MLGAFGAQLRNSSRYFLGLGDDSGESNPESSPAPIEDSHNCSAADVLRIYFLLARVLNRDVALKILESSDLTLLYCEKTYESSMVVYSNEPGVVVVNSQPIRILRAGGPRKSIKRIVFDVTGHDQGFATHPGSWTWFKAIVTPTPQNNDEAEQVEPRSMIEIGRNNRADKNWQQHVVEISSDADSQQLAFLDSIQNGDVLQIRACALYPGWRNYVQKGSITVEQALL